MARNDGMTIGTPPKTGKDERPWVVRGPDGYSQRCWYESTAKDLAKLKGRDYTVHNVLINVNARRAKKRVKA